jgi:Calcineurin-like phosphoesterase
MSTRRIVLLVAAALGIGAILAACGSDGGGDSTAPAGKSTKAARSDSKRTARVWAIGDGADGGDAARRVAEMVARSKPDRMLYLGDVYDNGTQEDFEDNYKPTFGRFDSIAAPTPGNHDWHNRADGYDPYWKAVGLVTNRHYYSFRTAGWEIISLNSEAGLEEGSPQRRWLEQRVRRPGTCRIAFWHRPFQNAGRHGDQTNTRPLWNAIRGRAALVLNGHDHNFQHFKPRDGIVQLISGAGGHARYESDGNDRRLVWDEDDEFGALRLDLRKGVARFRFVALPRRTLHKGTARCRPTG